jgi:hypothetical protein
LKVSLEFSAAVLPAATGPMFFKGTATCERPTGTLRPVFEFGRLLLNWKM